MNTNDPKGQAGSRKTPLGLIPAPAMEQIALAHKHGAERYGAYNWRKTGVCVNTYVHAILRHLNAWRDGEDDDPESGLSHIAHIGASCNILLDAAACGRLEDDREKRETTPEYVAGLDPAFGEDKSYFSVGRLGKDSEGRDVFKVVGNYEVDPNNKPPVFTDSEVFDKWMKEQIEPQDPTQRIVPIPEEMLPLPDAPEGKKWVGRGRFPDIEIGEGDTLHERNIYFYSRKWECGYEFSGNLFHIELIDDPDYRAPIIGGLRK